MFAEATTFYTYPDQTRGKSFSLVHGLARHFDVPRYSGVLFRRTRPQLEGPGSIWDESKNIYPFLGGRATDHKLMWNFPSGASIQFSHMQHDKDKYNHQSKSYAGIAFDELTQFEESQWWYLLSRARSTCGVKPFIRAATNPDSQSFVRKLIDWWIDNNTGLPIPDRSGQKRYFQRIDNALLWGNTRQELLSKNPHVEPLSFTFIPAKLADNPILTRIDPSYAVRLAALPRLEREQLKEGNWNTSADSGQFFKRHWFDTIRTAPLDSRIRVRAWDKAATAPSESNPDPDYTVGLRMFRDNNDRYYIEDVIRLRGGPYDVEQAMRNVASQDGPNVTIAAWRDPGQAGKNDTYNMARTLAGYNLKFPPATQSKQKNALPLSSQAEAGNVILVEGAWNQEFLEEAERFPRGHDDQIDAASLAFHCCVHGGAEWLNQIVRNHGQMFG